MSQRILFFGNERLATGVDSDAPIFRGLIHAGYDIAALIIAQHETNPSRNYRQQTIQAIASEYRIPVLAPSKLSEVYDELLAFNTAAAILVSYGKIIPQKIIDIFPHGIINIHPSLLPLHRGPVPLESVILNGELRTGISLMSLSASMDSGPIYFQQKIKLSGSESKQDLADTLRLLARDLLLDKLPDILTGTLTAKPQNNSAATYDALLTKADGTIDWNKSSVQIEREIRAFLFWPRSRTQIFSRDVIVTAASIANEQINGSAGTARVINNQLFVLANDGVLQINRLIPAGKKEMTASAFIAGYRK